MTVAPIAPAENGQPRLPGKLPVSVNAPMRGLDEAYRLSQALAMSSLLPKALCGKTNDVLVTILYGQELGLAPMQAIQGIYVVNGRPSMSAQLWVALARRAGHKVRVAEETATSCTVEIRRADEDSDDPPHLSTFTLDDAKQAKLDGKDVWKNFGADMLYSRAASRGCRRACPEIALGFYLEDELEAVQEDRPTLAQVATEREQQAAGVQDAEVVPDPSDEEVREAVAEIARSHEAEQATLPTEASQ